MNKAVLFLALLFAGCAGDVEHTRALMSLGFTEVKLGGVPLWGCGEGDDVFSSTEFSAKSPSGQRVSGVVRCSLFKFCTVRIQ